MLRITCICLILISNLATATVVNVILPHQHPDPEMVVLEVQRRLNESVSRRRALIMLTNEAMDSSSSSCLTGNPIDDCWRCDPNWESNRQQLANCGIGFGRNAIGGRGGQMYVVTDSSDDNPSNPKPGTLRFAVIQPQPLWITFSTNMQIKLKRALQVNSFKTIDGRGANIEIAGGACITVEHVSNVIIHNLHIHHCSATGGSDGDGISILASSNVWVDHCQLSQCKDGLIDVTRGSTAVTISNNYFSDHDKVMLLGHSDDFLPDTGMQVTLVYNRFGPGLIQRMPRCRHGYFHIANNDYTPWGMYAVGGSARPTINSQGNRYTAPADPHLKEVTKRLDAEASEWSGWNWRTEGDLLVNGAFFVPSGAGLTAQSQYDRASSVEPKPVALIDQVTVNVGVLGVNTRSSSSNPGANTGAPGTSYGYGGTSPNIGYGGTSPNIGYGGGPGGYYGGMVFGSGGATVSCSATTVTLVIVTVSVLFPRY